ncbi:MAG: hypothetical protein HWN81_00555 [Candidatus Lokiarchaeota archaeon]|nr:hypothetical protein [Candidatus Lokiarchaeota archaeon]
MRKQLKVKNIGIVGVKKAKNGGRINHSKEEWDVIVAGIKQREAERKANEYVISDERRASFEKAIERYKAREAAEKEEKKNKRKFYPRRKKKTQEVDLNEIPAGLIKSLGLKGGDIS